MSSDTPGGNAGHPLVVKDLFAGRIVVGRDPEEDDDSEPARSLPQPSRYDNDDDRFRWKN